MTLFVSTYRVFVPHSTCRIPGVLQRFSVSYLVAALVFVLTPRLPIAKPDAPPLSVAYLDRLLEWLIIIVLVRDLSLSLSLSHI